MTDLLAKTQPIVPHPPPPRGALVAALYPLMRAKVAAFLRLLAHFRWLQFLLVASVAGMLLYDRYLLCREFLFRYTDEDQVIMWYAAADLLNGRIMEPCFYGQDYNTCLEGFLAAPLGLLGMPWHMACPLVTVLLSLFPYLALAWFAWRRGHALTAAGILLVPLLLPVRYGMMTGMPRGFHPGIAVAMIPALLLLPPPPPRASRATPSRKPAGHSSGSDDAGRGGGEPALAGRRKPRHLQRSWPALRYFLAGAFALIAVEVGENSGVLLAAVGAYALLTSWREWKFWVFGLAGILAALPYPLLVDRFYSLDHPDYVIYLRHQNFQWGWNHFVTYWNQFLARPDGGVVLPDLVPIGIDRKHAPTFVAAAFAALGAWLWIRGRIAATAAAFAGVFITIASFGFSRVYATTSAANSASFPYARMYLAIPVLFVYLLFLANHGSWPRLSKTPLSRWITRGALAGLLCAAVYGYSLKQRTFRAELNREINAGGVVCPQIPVEQFYATAAEVKRVAAENKADVVIVGGGDRNKHLAYALYPVIGIDAIYGPWERRAWRLIEEYQTRHEAILFIAHPAPPGAKPAGTSKTVFVDRMGNVLKDLPIIPRSLRFKANDPAKIPRVTDPSRLQVTNITGNREYVAGQDFSIEKKPDGVELRRLPGSAIGDNELTVIQWRDAVSVNVPEIQVLKTGGKNAFQAGVPLGAVREIRPPGAPDGKPVTYRAEGNGR